MKRLVNVFGFAKNEDAVGQYIDGDGFHCKVIGVVKDYHQESLQNTFDPIVFYPEEERNLGNFFFKVQTQQIFLRSWILLSRNGAFTILKALSVFSF
jgi:hypothetical protein